MDRLPNQDVTTGYNDLQQVEALVQTAQKVVGSATLTMDPEFLQHAQNAVSTAKSELQNAKAAAADFEEEFLAKCESTLSQCEHQLQEALK